MCVEVSGDLSPAVSDRLRFQGAKLSGASPGMILSLLFFFVPDSSHFLSPGTARRCNQPAPHVASLDDTPPHCSSASQARPLQSDMVPEICAGSPNLHPLCSNDGRQRDVSGCPRRCSSGFPHPHHIQGRPAAKLMHQRLPTAFARTCLGASRNDRAVHGCILTAWSRSFIVGLTSSPPQMWKAGLRSSGLLVDTPLERSCCSGGKTRG